MSMLCGRRAFATLTYLLILGVFAPAIGQEASVPAAAPDATLYTSYYPGSHYQNIGYFVCGSTPGSEGCYASGTLGPFGHAGALIEGNAHTEENSVIRDIYIVDLGNESSTSEVNLYVYKKIDIVTASSDTVTVQLTNTVPLPLIGGGVARCSMAANGGFLFIGTDKSPQAVRVQKSNLAVTQIGGFDPPITVTSITADKYGYVTVTFGGFLSGENGFYQFGPNGQDTEDGGGAWFMLNTVMGVSTKSLPTSDAAPASRLIVRPKSEQEQSATTN
jgi:hypothetical protein